jgi:CO/xanthine dehydrogenase Mo-binding subunit
MSIGKLLPRIDGPIKVTGSARYTADLRVPNMLHAVFVTASVPAGRNRSGAQAKGDRNLRHRRRRL